MDLYPPFPYPCADFSFAFKCSDPFMLDFPLRFSAVFRALNFSGLCAIYFKKEVNALIKIVNKKTYKGPGEYIGRPSPLGNPFMIGRDGNRAEVMEKYKAWLVKQLPLNNPAMDELDRLYWIYKAKGFLTLICWCAPLPCHGDIIKDFILRMKEVK